MIRNLENQVNWFDQLGIPTSPLGSGPASRFGKTSRAHTQATLAETSPQSLKNSSASSSRKPQVFLCLRKDGPNPVWSTGTDGRLLGQLTMLGTLACLNAENVSLWSPTTGAYLPVKSSLSSILEPNSPEMEKYYLSAKACQGILNRAERRGKELPEELKQALLRQAASAE